MYQGAAFAEQPGGVAAPTDSSTMQQLGGYAADATQAQAYAADATQAQAYDYSQQAAYQQPQGAEAAVSGYNSYPVDASSAATAYSHPTAYTPVSAQAYTGDSRGYSKTAVYVGGLPVAAAEEGADGQPTQLDEAALHNFFFSSCGAIKAVRLQPGRNYCFIEFETPEAAAAAVALNGCQAVLNPQDPANPSRLSVKPAHERSGKPPPPPPAHGYAASAYASVDPAAAGGYDAAAAAYNGNGYWQQAQQAVPARPASPEPVSVRYTETEMKRVKEALKGSEDAAEFQLAVRRLGRWLESGECTKRTVDHFHTCLQTLAARARAFRQLRDSRQEQFVVEQQQWAESLVGQCDAMAAAMEAGSHQKVRDIMSRTQRKNLDSWVSTVNDIRRAFQLLASGEGQGAAAAALKPESSAGKADAAAGKRRREEGEGEAEGAEARVAELEGALSLRDGMIRNLTSRITALEAELAAQQPASPPDATGEGGDAPPAPATGRTPLDNCILSALSVYLMAHPQGAPLSELALYIHRVGCPGATASSGPAPPAAVAQVSTVLAAAPGVFRRADTGLGEPLWSVSALQSLPQLLSQART